MGSALGVAPQNFGLIYQKGGLVKIHTDFDFRSDSKGNDPDYASPTLRSYHEFLWSKPMPSGNRFLLKSAPGSYLVHQNENGKFPVSSDTIINSMRSRKASAQLISQITEDELNSFQSLGATIGGRLIFPSNRVNGKPTINVARGFSARIGDRFDLTLECIRRHYQGEASPLQAPLERYKSFFDLFGNFEGYVEFFLLNDLIENSKVKFFLPFTGEFGTKPLPKTRPEYTEYRHNSMEFASRRNQRIDFWARTLVNT